jgi:hypothetical protein
MIIAPTFGDENDDHPEEPGRDLPVIPDIACTSARIMRQCSPSFICRNYLWILLQLNAMQPRLPAAMILCHPMRLSCTECHDNRTVIHAMDPRRLEPNLPKVPDVPPICNLAGSNAICLCPASGASRSNVSWPTAANIYPESVRFISLNKLAMTSSRSSHGCSKLIFKSLKTSGTRSSGHACHAVQSQSTSSLVVVVSLGGM